MCASSRLDDWGRTNLWKMPQLIKLGETAIDPSQVVAVRACAYVDRYEITLRQGSMQVDVPNSSVDDIMTTVNQYRYAE